MKTQTDKHQNLETASVASDIPNQSNETRADYKSAQGIASWWQKDGTWHIALPCPDPNDQGQFTGGFRWTEKSFSTRNEAIIAIVTSHLNKSETSD